MPWHLFPGQGSQRPGMGADLYAAPEVRDLFYLASEVLGHDFLDTLTHGDEAALAHTTVAQPALLVCGVAASRWLAQRGVAAEGLAGHSLGEITALVAAGACGYEEALAFTRERARLMSESVPPGGMAAVMGLSRDDIAAHLADDVDIANENGPAQTIISGTHDALERAGATLKEAGAKRVMPLRVSGPFHSRHMRPAAEQFARVIEHVNFHAPEATFVSSVSGQPEHDPGRIRTLLAEQLCSRVRWTDVMRHIGPRPAWELGPGTVLAGLAKRTSDAPQVAPAGTIEELRARCNETGGEA